MNGIVLNEKELRDAKARVAKLTDALSSESGITQLVSNLPPEVVTQVTKMMRAERVRLLSAIAAFENAKGGGDASSLLKQSGTDPGCADDSYDNGKPQLPWPRRSHR